MRGPLLTFVFVLIACSSSFAQSNPPELPGWKGPSDSLPSINLAALGVGSSIFSPWEIETDGNVNTTELALITARGVFLWTPATGCTEPLRFYTPDDWTNRRTTWQWTLMKIAPNPRHQIVIWDTDGSDGKMPIAVQPIVYERCR